MPRLEEDIWQVYQDEGLVAYAISSSTLGAVDEEDLKDYSETMGLTMPVLIDTNTDVYDAWAISTPDIYAPYPREYVVDQEGNIAFLAADIDTEAMAEVIEELLAR